MAGLMNDELLRDWRTRERFQTYISDNMQAVFEKRVKELRGRRYSYATEKPTGLPPEAPAMSGKPTLIRHSHNIVMARLDAIRSGVTTIGWMIIVVIIIGFWLMKR
jgi:hypothetical protein